MSSFPSGLGPVLEAMFGATVVGTAVLTLVVMPILLALRWALGSRIWMPLVCRVALGAALAMGP
jgi:hypothetical protein